MGFVAIIDYGMGNLASVKKVCNAIGIESAITSDPKQLKAASKIILPGVGAFKDAIKVLNTSGMAAQLQTQAKEGKYILGICLGMQLLFSQGEEGSNNGESTKGLNLVEGSVIRFKKGRVPQIGWNSLSFTTTQDKIFASLPQNPYVYFAHSYHAKCNADNILSYTEYGITYPSAVKNNNIYGMQFHPEKSGDIGLKILQNFSQLK